MKLLVILLLVPSFATSFQYWRPNVYICRKRGTSCISENLFVYCKRYFQHINVDTSAFKCPKGFICQESSYYPCSKDSNHSDENDDDVINTSPEPFITTRGIDNDSETTINKIIKPDNNEDDTLDEQASTSIDIFQTTEILQDVSLSVEEEDTTGNDFFQTTTDSLEDLWTDSDDTSIYDDATTSPDADEDNTITYYDDATTPSLTDEDGNTEKHIITTRKDLFTIPQCTGPEIFPGPTCGQYYQCQKISIWFWFSDYIPILKICDQDLHFSIEKSSCVPLSESNCTD